ncbi:MAG: phytanoyl-CoA dioxygenase family protein [Deinococcus sp.]|nr:phytanoyl-CoA dioxygenase family protein [Deinococcus sp.]
MNKKQTFDAEGFLKIEGFLSEEQIQEIESELSHYLQTMVPTLPMGDIVYETEASFWERREIRNLWRMEKYSEYLAALARQKDVLELVGTLVNGEPVLMAVELFAKPAHIGSAVPYHQDNAYFNLAPPDALTCWLALDDSTVENGCVYYVRGSHRQGLLPHKASLVPGNSYGLARIPGPAEVDEVPGIIGRGGIVLHHCCLLHRSEKNRGERSRRGLLLVYKAAHCQIDPVGMEQYQAAARALQSHLAAQGRLS